MTKNTLLALCSLAFSGAATAQVVTINFNADTLRDPSSLAAPTSSIALLVIDVDGNGFGLDQGSFLPGSSITPGSTIGSSNDLIVFSSDLSTFATDGVWSISTGQLTLSGAWTAGDAIALVWLPTLNADSTTAAAGTAYGFLNTGFATPAAGGTVQYQVLSTTNSGFFSSDANTLNVTDAQTIANLTVAAIPEPSTYALLLSLGGLAVVSHLRRRR